MRTSTDTEYTEHQNQDELIVQLADAARRANAGNVVKNHVLIAQTFGLVPLPLFDITLLIGNQIAMIHSLSVLYDVPFSEHQAKPIVLSLLAGSAPVLGVVGLSSSVKIMPGVGTLLGSGSIAVFGGALTYAIGQVFIAHFESGGTLADMRTREMRTTFRDKLKKGKSYLIDAGRNATSKVATAVDHHSAATPQEVIKEGAGKHD